MGSGLLDKSYEPKAVEQRWYAFWEKQQLFEADEKKTGRTFSIVIPPPNVTGVLHMGHALNNTLQDILCRYHRLRGFNVLWMPGTDHAGIATQNVVEKKLSAEGLSRHELGREQFIEAVWTWREKYGSAIINQLKRLGASCDWQRERFTMDAGLSKAVRTVFVQLYQEGLIYRGDYIINWCPRCRTALADLEVEHGDQEGSLYHIRYPYEEGSGGVVVATTRPETMLGDTAVAVNPADERYRQLSARRVMLPLLNRVIPIIEDDYVDMRFGTGALKVTPAHDPNDFEIALRHGLPNVKVIGEDGSMTAEAGPYVGLDRFACRRQLVADLEQEGLLVKIERHSHSVGHCYRCQTVVEPNLSQQWFVRTRPLAEKAIAAVREGRTRIIPQTWEKTYFDWMNNIRDWCISRQIWWGHQIPAWTCSDCGELVVDMTAPQSCPSCGGRELVQETDVLDTWFSSALWPFSTMGWPEKTPLLKAFYPTSVLVTGFDILFFWVARMMMMGIHFMGDIPFRDVYVHALVRDEDGKKMSKSTGNVIDPLDIIENYGTDAFRFTLTAFAAQGRDVKMSEKRVEGYRHFINKLWNAVRFSLMHLDQGYPTLMEADMSLQDRWVLSRLDRVIRNVPSALEDYRFNDAASELYHFVWHEFCDWYLEAVKTTLQGAYGEARREAACSVLWRVLTDTVILLHPIIPFVTEEIWHKIPGTQGSVMRADFPVPLASDDNAYDAAAETEMGRLVEVITGIRNIRGEMNLSPALALDVQVQTAEDGLGRLLAAQREIIVNLAKLKSLTISASGAKPQASATAVVAGAMVYVSLKGVIDFEQEAQRLQKEVKKIETELNTVAKKLANEDFLRKAPPAVVDKVKVKNQDLLAKKQKLQNTLDRIQAVG